MLSPEKREVQPLDLYLNISQDITISVKGRNEVHLSGYFEPNNSIEDQMYGGGPIDMDDDEEGEEESDDESAADKIKQLTQLVKAGKKGDIVGFEKGGDLEKSLKAANKNT